jgi:uncharacterized protein (DUF2336 family)
MSHARSLIEDIEGALAKGTGAKRTEVLSRITDLFLTSPAQLTEEQTSLFDDVISRLITHVEQHALVELSARLAPIANAPAHVVQRLASDDAIEVAGPLLASSDRLTDQDLVAIAASKSQSHMSKIAERRQLSPMVTDVLVDHGDRNVVHKVAENSGASFSKIGMSTLVMRADGDNELIETITRRTDLPMHVFGQLLSYATDQTRERLLAARPADCDIVNQVLERVSTHVTRLAATAKDWAAAQRFATSFGQDTGLTQSKLLEFADGGKITELIAALSVLSGIPTNLIGRLICDQNSFGTIVLCKATKLDWSITHAILTARLKVTGQRIAEIDGICEEFECLSDTSARRLLHFWQGRMKTRMAFENRQAV